MEQELPTSIQNYQALSKDLPDSLQEIAQALITIQYQPDSFAVLVLQNRRGLDLLTAEKGGLCLFLDESCCFYANQSGVVQKAAKNLTDRASRICQRLSNSWQSWLTDWNWMPWFCPFLDHSYSLSSYSHLDIVYSIFSRDSSRTESEPFLEIKSRLFCSRPWQLE